MSKELTKRELQTLKLLYLENDEISARLDISEATIRTYLQGLREKLKVNKRHKIMINALKRGIIKLDEIVTE